MTEFVLPSKESCDLLIQLIILMSIIYFPQDSKQSPQILTEKEIEEVKVANKERAAKLEEDKVRHDNADSKAAEAEAVIPESETPKKQEILQELTQVWKLQLIFSSRNDHIYNCQVIADVAVLSTDSVAVVEESWQGDAPDTVAVEVVAVAIAEAETITEKEDEDEKEFDPFLQYGGSYYEDDKNNRCGLVL